jgi:hypothetical protein
MEVVCSSNSIYSVTSNETVIFRLQQISELVIWMEIRITEHNGVLRKHFTAPTTRKLWARKISNVITNVIYDL